MVQVPGLIQPAGSAAQGVPSPAVAVTATSQGTLGPPQGWSSAWALISNASPFLMTVTSAEGAKTIQPYFADLVRPTAVGVAYKMSLPPGLIGVGGANPYVQIDWYISGGSAPSGIYPYPLTSAAIAALLAPNALIAAPSLAITSTPLTIPVTIPETLGLMCLFQQAASPGDITVTAQIPGAALSLVSFTTLAAAAGNMWFQILPIIGNPSNFPNQVNFTFTLSTAGTSNSLLYVWAVNSDARGFIAPVQTSNTQNIAANSVGTTVSFPVSGLDGVLSTFAATGVGTAAPTGDWVNVLQYYTGSSTWIDIAVVGGGATQPAFTAPVRTPPGTCRFQPINLAAAAQGVVSMLVQ